MTLEEAAAGYTARFIEDLAARGVQATAARQPNRDSVGKTTRTVAYWMSAPNGPEEGFAFELRHRDGVAPVSGDLEDHFTLFIDGGKWEYVTGVELIADLHGRDQQDAVLLDGVWVPRHAEVAGQELSYGVFWTIKGEPGPPNPYYTRYFRCPACEHFAIAGPQDQSDCACGLLTAGTNGTLRTSDGTSRRVPLYG